MKKLWLVTGALTCILMLNAEAAHAQAGGGGFISADGDQLDQTENLVSLHTAARNAAAEFYPNLESGTRIAVVAMEADSARMSSYLIDEMIIVLAGTGRLIVADRNQLNQAAQDLHFQTSQAANETAARSLGRFMGVQVIVMGSLEPTGNSLYFRVRIIDVDTPAILGVYETNVQNDRMISVLRGEAHFHIPRNEPPSGEGEDPTRSMGVGIGVSVGTAFTEPLLIGTLQATLAPQDSSFIRFGLNLGLLSATEQDSYNSISMFAHYSFFPLSWRGWHIGAGGSLTFRAVEPTVVLALDFVTGLKFMNMIDISYNLRTNFYTVFSNRISVGFTHRFR